MTGIPQTIGIQELANVLGVSRAQIYRLRSEGRGEDLPPTIMVGTRPRWRVETVNKWLEDREGIQPNAAA